MTVAIRLSRVGRKGKSVFRIVAAPKFRARDGRFLEVLGTYDPTQEEKCIVKKDRIAFWISQGAQASDRVQGILKRAPK